MLKKCAILLGNLIWLSSLASKNIKYFRAADNIEKTQLKLLRKIVRQNKYTCFGKIHYFDRIKSYQSYTLHVPLSEYDDYKKFIWQIKEGRQNILTREKVMLLELTSGSTSASKLIPYTKSLKDEFQNGISPWLFNLYSKNWALLQSTAYWSITPLPEKEEIKSKVPIGFDSDTEYLGLFGKIIADNIMCVPPEIKEVTDFGSFCYLTQLFLIADENLGLISIWNPTFLMLILEDLKKNLASILNDLKTRSLNPNLKLSCSLRTKLVKRMSISKNRLWQLQKLRLKKAETYQDLFSRLKLISCWGDGFAKTHLDKLKQQFPNATIQPKGLIATEAFISFPMLGRKGSLLAVNSHFFEFQAEDGRILLAHQIMENEAYSVIVTTGGGLYRYRMHDLVRVVGFYKQVPLIEFIGKEDLVSDMFGEKINSHHVSSIFNNLLKHAGIVTEFNMLAPEESMGKYYYSIFIQPQKGTDTAALIRLRGQVENCLRENCHYKYCRKIGQLRKLRIFRIKGDASSQFLRHKTKQNLLLGSVKTNQLSRELGWSKVFKGDFL